MNCRTPNSTWVRGKFVKNNRLRNLGSRKGVNKNLIISNKQERDIWLTEAINLPIFSKYIWYPNVDLKNFELQIIEENNRWRYLSSMVSVAVMTFMRTFKQVSLPVYPPPQFNTRAKSLPEGRRV